MDPKENKTMEMTRNEHGSLSEAQLQTYEQEGYLVLPGLLSEEELRPIRDSLGEKVSEIAEALFAQGLITDKLEGLGFKHRLAGLFAGMSDGEFIRFGRSWRDRKPGFFHLMSNPKILDAVEGLIGPEIFSNPVYNVRPKVPKVAAGAVPWHQDKSYWPDANSNPVITVWVPLVDADLENGCLRIAPGTQKTKVLSYHSDTYTGTAYTEVDEDLMEKTLAGTEVVAVPVKAGSAILFNDRCLHMSTLNQSEDRVRWSVDLRYQPTDQDPMEAHGAGFLARSRRYPERVALLEDWLAERPERGG